MSRNRISKSCIVIERYCAGIVLHGPETAKYWIGSISTGKTSSRRSEPSGKTSCLEFQQTLVVGFAGF